MKLLILIAAIIAFTGCGGTKAKTEILAAASSPATSPKPSATKTSKCVDVDPAKVFAGTQYPRCDGSVGTGKQPLCSSDGETGCITSAAYPAADTVTTLVAGNIKSGVTIAGVAGEFTGSFLNCLADGDSGCIVDGVTFKAADVTTAIAGNIKSGVQIAGVSGQYPSSSYPLPGATGSELPAFSATMATGTYEYFDQTGARSTGTIADGGTINPTTSNQTISAAGTVYRKVIIQEDPNLVSGNILSGTSIFGVGGNVTASPASCTSNGSQACVAAGSYYAATACSSDGGSTCYVDGSGTYKAALMTSAVVGNIKSGVKIAGVTGQYPSSTYKLPGASGTDLTNFITQLTESGTFEFFDSAGNRYTGSGDPNIAAANVVKGVTFSNLSITGTATPAAWDLRYGKTFGTTQGLLKTQCRNMAGGTCSVSPTTNLTTAACTAASGTWTWTFQYGICNAYSASYYTYATCLADSSTWTWLLGASSSATDVAYSTIDDYNNNHKLPMENPWASDSYGGDDVLCGYNSSITTPTWADVTTTTNNGDVAWQDLITGLTWSKVNPGDASQVAAANWPCGGSSACDPSWNGVIENSARGGTYTAGANMNWWDAQYWCQNLKKTGGTNYGGYTTWRLPTEKELMAAYEHGIYDLNGGATDNIGNLAQWFWSSSAESDYVGYAWGVRLSYGSVYTSSKVTTGPVLCVR